MTVAAINRLVPHVPIRKLNAEDNRSKATQERAAEKEVLDPEIALATAWLYA